jgi:hypothetical protein
MVFSTPESAVRWILVALGIGIVVSVLAGLAAWREAQRLPFYALRRRATQRGVRYFLVAAIFGLMAVIAWLFGPQALDVGVAEIAVPTDTLTPSASPTLTLSPTITLTYTPSATSGPPTITFTPSKTPTETGTARLPLDIVTPIPSTTITPPADAVAGPISITPFFDYPARQASDYFDPTGKTLYAVFEYNNFAKGMQWSAVWYRDAAPIFIETLPWDGETGGWGYSELALDPWPTGTYEVRIFAGERWLRSTIFFIVEELPTNTPQP